MSRATYPARLAAGLLALLALGACEVMPAAEPPPPTAGPVARPAPPPELPPPSPPAPPPAPSAESEALAIYYRRLEADLLSQGLLRGDGGAEDAPFTDTMLARNFVAIALFDEYAPDSATRAAGDRASRLRRWEDPIRLAVEFGDAVNPAQAARDRAAIAAYAARLQRLTDVPIATVGEGEDPNVRVLIWDEDDREKGADRLRAVSPGIADALVRDIVNLPRSTLCLVFAPLDDPGAGYSRAVVLIRAELPPLLRTACIHEELAQGMGLVNDSPEARPSIFNDDDEFGLLTRHDELLLRMLYDDRLRPGMAADEAAPVAAAIASELVGGRGGPA